jgi:hypothetical protein
MVYRVDFWDAFDGWIADGFPVGTMTGDEFEKEEDAIKLCKEKQLKNPPNSMDEHYGVIDLNKGFEVFCGKTWYERELSIK